MKTIKKVAATCVLLFGFSQAQQDFDSGDFIFKVEHDWDISCDDGSADVVISGLDAVAGTIITNAADAATSPAEIVCDIKINLSHWDIKVAALNSGKFIDGEKGELKIGGDEAKLAIYADLVPKEDFEIRIADDGNYSMASPVGSAGAIKTVGAGTFSLADMFVEDGTFMSEGLVEATLTIKGAALSANTKTRVTSGLGTYVETLTFEFEEAIID